MAKVRARTRGWNRIDLYVAPEGDVSRPAPDDLKQRLVAFFEDRRMVGTSVLIRDPVPVPIDVAVDGRWPSTTTTRGRARSTSTPRSRDLLAFAQRRLRAGPLYLSKVYEAVEALPGVLAATVTRFRRRDRRRVPDLRRGLLERAAGEVTTCRSLRGEIPPEGRIDIGEFELPVAGEIVVTVATR